MGFRDGGRCDRVFCERVFWDWVFCDWVFDGGVRGGGLDRAVGGRGFQHWLHDDRFGLRKPRCRCILGSFGLDAVPRGRRFEDVLPRLLGGLGVADRVALQPLRARRRVEAELPDRVVGEPLDDLAQFKLVEPDQRDRVRGVRRAHDVAADRRGRGAVSGMVGGHDHRARERLGVGQRRAHRDRQGLLCEPALAEQPVDLLRRRGARGGQLDRLAQRGAGLLMSVPSGQFGEGAVHGLRQRPAIQQLLDDHRERSGGQVAAGVAVGQHRGHRADLERLGGVGGPQPGGSGPHYPAAALRVVEPVGERALLVAVGVAMQRLDAGGAGRTAREQGLLLDQPAVRRIRGQRTTGVLPVEALRVQPALIGVLHLGGRHVFAEEPTADVGPDEAVQGEQRHLGLVADRAPGPVRVDEIGQAVRAVFAADVLQRVVLDRVAERVTGGAAEQQAQDPVRS